MLSRIAEFFATLSLLLEAHQLRKSGSAALRLPPVARKEPLSKIEAEALARRVNRVTRFFARNTGHFCWYRSYPLAVLLRRGGMDVRLNIGVLGLDNGKQGGRGHAWLSLNGNPMNEIMPEATTVYPEFLADNGHGVNYWAARNRELRAERRA